jgi:hypothetical protein
LFTPLFTPERFFHSLALTKIAKVTASLAQTQTAAELCPISGVKQTWAFAEIRFRGRY